MNSIEVEIDKAVYLDCYHHILEQNDIDIELLVGGRDSGKSRFLAQLTTDQAMSLDYFRCLLIKETHESIKDAQWQMIKDNAEQWGVDGLFKFITSPLSIRCLNNNTFAARGMDNPGKIRSFSNPSHAWVEEANQISETAFTTLLTGLRNDYGNVKLFLSLNPEADTPDFQEFWLYKMFFKHWKGEKVYVGVLRMKVQLVRFGKLVEEEVVLKFRITHTTYHDNPYVSLQRIAFHESLKETNPYWYRVFTLGLWGNKENESPYLTTWSREKHISPVELHATPNLYLFTCWDFNRNPQVCTIIQWDEAKEVVYIIEVFKIPNTGTDKMCDLIAEKYPPMHYIYIVNGDYSGNTPSSLYEEEVTNYTVIKNKFGLADGQLKIEPNPKLEDNRTLVNMVFHRYNVQVCPVKAKPFIFDAENVKYTAEGKIKKEDREDPAQQADCLDTVRYFFNKNFQWILKLVPNK